MILITFLPFVVVVVVVVFFSAEVGGFCEVPGQCLCREGFGPSGVCNECKICSHVASSLLYPGLHSSFHCLLWLA